MTSNQIAWQNAMESRRSNLAREAETNRSNVARETETNRHNLADEGETHRHNVVGEQETALHNRNTEGLTMGQLVEANRHNTVTERIQSREADNRKEANRIQEKKVDNDLLVGLKNYNLNQRKYLLDKDKFGFYKKEEYPTKKLLDTVDLGRKSAESILNVGTKIAGTIIG